MRIAVAQFDPDPDPDVNAATVGRFAARASTDGADLLLTPEGSLVAFLTDPGAPARAAQATDGPFARALVELSGRYGLTVAAGSFVPDPDSARVHNTLLIAQAGELVAAYRKVHLYDAFSFVESAAVTAGTQAPPVLEIGGLRVGFATCYDLRFPELFRVLSGAGAQIMALASAWVRGPLKEEHWLTLLRARAIENTCYLVAADQVGPAGIGRSAAFDPAGLPLFDLGVADPGYGLLDCDPGRVAEVRRSLPALAHTRFRIDPQPVPPDPQPVPPDPVVPAGRQQQPVVRLQVQTDRIKVGAAPLRRYASRPGGAGRAAAAGTGVMLPVVRLQVQTDRIKVGAAPLRRYEPAVLESVPQVEISPSGVVGLGRHGERLLDVHHRDHPRTRDPRGRAGLSVLGTGEVGVAFAGSATWRCEPVTVST